MGRQVEKEDGMDGDMQTANKGGRLRGVGRE